MGRLAISGDRSSEGQSLCFLAGQQDSASLPVPPQRAAPPHSSRGVGEPSSLGGGADTRGLGVPTPVPAQQVFLQGLLCAGLLQMPEPVADGPGGTHGPGGRAGGHRPGPRPGHPKGLALKAVPAPSAFDHLAGMALRAAASHVSESPLREGHRAGGHFWPQEGDGR